MKKSWGEVREAGRPGHGGRFPSHPLAGKRVTQSFAGLSVEMGRCAVVHKPTDLLFHMKRIQFQKELRLQRFQVALSCRGGRKKVRPYNSFPSKSQLTPALSANLDFPRSHSASFTD